MTSSNHQQEILIQQDLEPQPSTVCFNKILVAIDYLASSPYVFEQAMHLARVNGSRLLIFHCTQGQLSDLVTGIGMSAYGGIYSPEIIEAEEAHLQETHEELQAWLGSFVQRATEAGIAAEYNCKIGDPGQQICTYANTWGADLIVIGRRGRKGLAELLLGSVSNYVIHHAPCSVLVIQ